MNRLSALLGLYPRAWRSRYGDEIADLLTKEPMGYGTVVDTFRGAVFAHLHPELVEPDVMAAAGAGSLRLRRGVPVLSVAILGVLLSVAGYVLGAAIVFAWSPSTCPSGYDKRAVDHSSQIGYVEYLGEYDCVRESAPPTVLHFREEREIGLYLTRPGIRVFDFDFVQQRFVWVGLAPR